MQLWTGKASHFSLKKIADTCSRKFDALFSDHMTHCLTYWLTDRMSNCLTNWFSDLLTDWLTLCLINLINGLTDWLYDSMIDLIDGIDRWILFIVMFNDLLMINYRNSFFYCVSNFMIWNIILPKSFIFINTLFICLYIFLSFLFPFVPSFIPSSLPNISRSLFIFLFFLSPSLLISSLLHLPPLLIFLFIISVSLFIYFLLFFTLFLYIQWKQHWICSVQYHRQCY